MNENKHMNILCLDGGGSKGVYTLGVLSELEKSLNCEIYKKFDLVYGTSTGSIIASLLALGYTVEEVKKIYFDLIPKIMRCRTSKKKTAILEEFGSKIFEDKYFNSFKTRIGIVSMNYETQEPLIFKTHVDQAYGVKSSFEAGFGLKIKDAVIASCSAVPIFKQKQLLTKNKGKIIAIDGGFIANNPTLFSIVDAREALGRELKDIKVLSIGVGNFIEKPIYKIEKLLKASKYYSIISRILNASSNTTEILTNILYKDLNIIRVNKTFNEPEYGTNMVEKDIEKLEKLFQLGIRSFAIYEDAITKMFNDCTTKPD